ncbi:MAG: OmpH family outer membrane protein [Victivallaceae bacterium]
MKKLPLLFLLASTCLPLSAQEIRSLDLKRCFEESLLGQKERTSLELLKKQFSENTEKLEKELETLGNQLQDEDYMAGLSMKAAEELRKKFDELGQEYNIYHNQYYQLLNQANMRATQKLLKAIKSASLQVLKKENLDLIVNEEVILASKEGIDVTDKILNILEKDFKESSHKIEADDNS